MHINNFVSSNEILSDVLMITNDEELRQGLTRGYYKSQVQQALEELAFETFFDEITDDIKLDSEFDTRLNFEMPKNAFNIRQIYLFNSDCCSPESSVIVHWKRQFNNNPGGTNYTGKRVDNNRAQRDPIYPTDTSDVTFPSSNLYWANIQNGLIMFSSNCSGFTNLRLIYNGTAGAIGDEPIIPRFLRQAVVDYATEKALRILKTKEPRKYRNAWLDVNAQLNDPRNGSWIKAERRVKSLDTWQRDSIKEWIGKPNY